MIASVDFPDCILSVRGTEIRCHLGVVTKAEYFKGFFTNTEAELVKEDKIYVNKYTFDSVISIEIIQCCIEILYGKEMIIKQDTEFVIGLLYAIDYFGMDHIRISGEIFKYLCDTEISDQSHIISLILAMNSGWLGITYHYVHLFLFKHFGYLDREDQKVARQYLKSNKVSFKYYKAIEPYYSAKERVLVLTDKHFTTQMRLESVTLKLDDLNVQFTREWEFCRLGYNRIQYYVRILRNGKRIYGTVFNMSDSANEYIVSGEYRLLDSDVDQNSFSGKNIGTLIYKDSEKKSMQFRILIDQELERVNVLAGFRI